MHMMSGFNSWNIIRDLVIRVCNLVTRAEHEIRKKNCHILGTNEQSFRWIDVNFNIYQLNQLCT